MSHCSIFIAAFEGEVAGGYLKGPFQKYLSSPCSNRFRRPWINIHFESTTILEGGLLEIGMTASDPGRVPLSRKKLYILRPDLKLSIFTCICDSVKGMYFKVEVFWEGHKDLKESFS